MDAELLLRIANRTDITAGMRGFFLNDAYLKVANEFDHAELQGLVSETVTVGNSSLTPTVTDIWWPDLVKDVTNAKLLTVADKEQIVGVVLPNGPPSRFYWYGEVFYLDSRPLVNTSIGIWYVKHPVELVSGVASVLDPIFDPLIVMFAAQLAFETGRDFAEAHIQEVTANNYVARQRLPLREAKKNDYRTGIRVRMR